MTTSDLSRKLAALLRGHDLRGQSPSGSPAAGESVIEQWSRNANLNGPVNDAHTLAVMLKNNVSAVVSGLLLRGGPAAIAWFIGAIVVWVAIDGQSFFIAFSHVGDEVGYIKPSFADGDSATAIAFIALVFGVCAAIHHRPPNLKQWVTPFAMFGHALFVKATAALRLSVAKARNLNVTRRTPASTLDATEFRVSTFFPKDPENGVTAVSVASGNNFRRSFNHKSFLLIS